ncbi:hypothetical protein PGQ11_002503 [Apiospora arundinis]|uniref:Transposase n=1 Tax=Apiospora arundinis TaxID=335852 RepID=A0ABR2JIC4_9PEZI
MHTTTLHPLRVAMEPAAKGCVSEADKRLGDSRRMSATQHGGMRIWATAQRIPRREGGVSSSMRYIKAKPGWAAGRNNAQSADARNSTGWSGRIIHAPCPEPVTGGRHMMVWVGGWCGITAYPPSTSTAPGLGILHPSLQPQLTLLHETWERKVSPQIGDGVKIDHRHTRIKARLRVRGKGRPENRRLVAVIVPRSHRYSERVPDAQKDTIHNLTCLEFWG